MDNETKKKRLASYVTLRTEVENLEERLSRLESEAEMPAVRMGDGSKHTGGSGDRMERAVLRLMEYKEKNLPKIQAARRKMDAIEDAIDALIDPLERACLRIRFLDGEGSRLVKWDKVAVAIYGSDDEKNVRAIHRLKDFALNNINLDELEELEQ